MRISVLLTALLACQPGTVVKADETGNGETTDTSADDSAANDRHTDDDGDGMTEADGDCDDTDASVYAGADEVWHDGIDQACDGGDDDDQDGDGYALGADCDDTDATINPDATEVQDGIDNNCDGATDEGTDAVDDDGDGYAEADGDCDDADANRSPGAREVCDGAIDEDCDGEVDEDLAVLGTDPACPAASCLELRSFRPGAPDGNYWIAVGGVAYEVVCDMTRDTGGWTLVANFVWPGNPGGVAGWTSGGAVGSGTTDRTLSFKLDDSEINALVSVRYRARGRASWCTLEDRSTGACTVDTTLYWDSACVYSSGTTSSGACTAAYQTYDLDAWTELSNPCAWHYGLTSADCGVTSEFGTSHDGDHVFAGIVGTYIHGYDGRPDEDPSVEVWVR